MKVGNHQYKPSVFVEFCLSTKVDQDPELSYLYLNLLRKIKGHINGPRKVQIVVCNTVIRLFQIVPGNIEKHDSKLTQIERDVSFCCCCCEEQILNGNFFLMDAVQPAKLNFPLNGKLSWIIRFNIFNLGKYNSVFICQKLISVQT